MITALDETSRISNGATRSTIDGTALGMTLCSRYGNVLGMLLIIALGDALSIADGATLGTADGTALGLTLGTLDGHVAWHS